MSTVIFSLTCAPCCGVCLSAGTALFQCRIRGGTAALCGYDEFTSPSTPPKKYRRKTLAGTFNRQVYVGAGCVTTNCNDFYTYSGHCDYDAATCALTVGGQVARTGTCPNNTNPICDLLVNQEGIGYVGDVLVSTQTVQTLTNDKACYHAFPSVRCLTDGATATLSIEDTETAAIARLLAGAGGTWGAWITSGAAGCTGTPPSCCLARFEQRTTLFTFVYQESQWRITDTGLTPSTLYYGYVQIYRRTFGTGSYVLYKTLTVSGTTDGAGALDIHDDVENTEGYETYAIAALSCP